MLKIPVIADNISNLTDARYFAAWGVFGLIFRIDGTGTTMSSLMEIQQWIEGPNLYLELFQDATPHFRKLCTTLDNAGRCSLLRLKSQEILKVASTLTSLKLDGVIVQPGKGFRWELLDELPPPVFIDSAELTGDVIVKSDPGIGIVVDGSAEERTGFKSFDQLDILFSTLEVNST
jgi:hypothetical protein